MLKKLLFTILLMFVPSLVFAGSYEVDIFDITVTAFVGIDSASLVDVNPNNNEVGINSNVIVRILDLNGNPLSGHTVVLYAQGSPAGVTFVQPLNPSDADGYTYGKVKAIYPGAYVIRAYDTTYGQQIDIQDSDSFFTFPLPVPNMHAEPYYTKGTSNKVYWNDLGGISTYSYYVQASKSPTFSTIEANSGWVTSLSYQFNNLDNNQMYYYRLKAKNVAGVESGWSNVVFSVQDATPPVIKYVSIDKVMVNSKLSSITIIFDVTDNFAVATVQFHCQLQNGELDECGSLEKSGSRYKVNVPLSDLEKGPFGNFYENYVFCVFAQDKAGNSTNSCDFSFDISEYVDTGVPIFTNLINSIIDRINDYFRGFAKAFDFILEQTQELILQILSFLLFILIIIVLMGIAAGGIFVVPTFMLSVILNWLKFFGFKRKGQYLGFIYDAISGKRVKYAKIRIFDGSNVLVLTDVTNKEGEFFGDLEVGKYRVMVDRTHYLFPSQMYKEYKLKLDTKPYLGEFKMVSNRTPMELSIPLDPINIYADWERQAKMEKRIIGFMKALSFLLIAIGLGVAFTVFEKSPNVINIILLVLYIPAVAMFVNLSFRLKGIVKT